MASLYAQKCLTCAALERMASVESIPAISLSLSSILHRIAMVSYKVIVLSSSFSLDATTVSVEQRTALRLGCSRLLPGNDFKDLEVYDLKWRTCFLTKDI